MSLTVHGQTRTSRHFCERASALAFASVLLPLSLACGGGTSSDGATIGDGVAGDDVSGGGAAGPGPGGSGAPIPPTVTANGFDEEPALDMTVNAAQPLPRLDSDVNVIITADNAYGFGYGSGSELVNYFGGVENITSNDIFQCPVGNGPEQYLVPAADSNAGSFLYIVSYADKQTTQGVVGKFFRDGAPAIFTGNGAWQVCATGQDFDPGLGGPSLDAINQQLTVCNAGGGEPGATSQGWVGTDATPNGSVVFGEDNSTERDRPSPGNEFRVACDVDAEARWMWYDWRADPSMGSPFIWPGGAENATRDFLIFRLGAELIPSADPSGIR